MPNLHDGHQELSSSGSSLAMVAVMLAVFRAAALLTAQLRGSSTGGLVILFAATAYNVEDSMG